MDTSSRSDKHAQKYLRLLIQWNCCCQKKLRPYLDAFCLQGNMVKILDPKKSQICPSDFLCMGVTWKDCEDKHQMAIEVSMKALQPVCHYMYM